MHIIYSHLKCFLTYEFFGGGSLMGDDYGDGLVDVYYGDGYGDGYVRGSGHGDGPGYGNGGGYGDGSNYVGTKEKKLILEEK